MEQITLYRYLEKEAFKRKMTMTDLSLAMGFSKAVLPRIKRQRRGPTVKSYYRMAEFLKIDPELLFDMPINDYHIKN